MQKTPGSEIKGIKAGKSLIAKIYKRLPVHSTKSILVSTSITVVVIAGVGYTVVHFSSSSNHKNNSVTTHSASKTAIKKTVSSPKYVAGSPCQTSQLTLAPVIEVGGDLSGQIGGVFSFTNSSNTTCTIEGYPTVQIGDFTSTSHGSIDGLDDPGPALVTLTPGLAAYFGVGWWFENFNDGGLVTGCVAENYLVSTPPNNKASLSTSVQLGTVCPSSGSQGLGNTTAIRLPSAFNVDFSCSREFFDTFPDTQALPACSAPTPAPPPQPVTLLNNSGTNDATQSSSNNCVNTPDFTPSAEYYVNITDTPLSVQSYFNFLIATQPDSLVAENGYQAVEPYAASPFSYLVDTSLRQPQHLTVCAASWTITVTEYSQPMYTVVQAEGAN